MEPILDALKVACADISNYLRDSGASTIEVLETKNTFGETQLAADVYADQRLFACLQGLVLSACSEENTEPQAMGGDRYWVTFDPLDGSSIIDTNFAVGTIFGIWDCQDLVGSTGRNLVCSGMAVYGPKTVMLHDVMENGVPQVNEVTLVRGEWITTKTNLQIKPETKLFAPANLRAVNEHEGYKRLIDYWQSSAYTLRYTGGSVPDIYQIFIKGSGVFSNPTTDKSPPKLRYLYEAAPMGRLVEIAGGRSSIGQGSVLDYAIDGYNQKVQLCVGSVSEVERFEQYINS